MAQKVIKYKDLECVIIVDDVDAELLEKSWSLTYDRKKDKNGNYYQGSYARIKRTLTKAEKAIRGTSRTSLHKEVWIKHFGDVPAGMTIDHIDHNPANNSILNLQLLPIKENIQRQKRIKKNGKQVAEAA